MLPGVIQGLGGRREASAGRSLPFAATYMKRCTTNFMALTTTTTRKTTYVLSVRVWVDANGLGPGSGSGPRPQESNVPMSHYNFIHCSCHILDMNPVRTVPTHQQRCTALHHAGYLLLSANPPVSGSSFHLGACRRPERDYVSCWSVPRIADRDEDRRWLEHCYGHN